MARKDKVCPNAVVIEGLNLIYGCGVRKTPYVMGDGYRYYFPPCDVYEIYDEGEMCPYYKASLR